MDVDVLIVGGGPAGASAALVLARCRRSVLLCDDGAPRNRASSAIHGLIAADGMAPEDFRKRTHATLAKYRQVKRLAERVCMIRREADSFLYQTTSGRTGQAKNLVLATGLVDELPELPGVEQFYGHSVHHCLYCDAYEYSDMPLAAYGKGTKGADLARMMLLWSKDILLCTDGEPLSEMARRDMDERAILVIEHPIVALHGKDRSLAAIEFENGQFLSRVALFFSTGCRPASDLWRQVGCASHENGSVRCDPLTCETSVEGVFVAGDASRDVLQVAAAMGEGVRAAIAINKKMLREDGLCQ